MVLTSCAEHSRIVGSDGGLYTWITTHEGDQRVHISMAKKNQQRSERKVNIMLIAPSGVEDWLREKADTVQGAVELVVREWLDRGAKLPAPPARVPPEDVFRSTIRLGGELAEGVLRVAAESSTATSTLVNGVVVRAAGVAPTVRYEERPRHSEERGARLVAVLVAQRDLAALDRVREETPRRVILDALLDAWIDADCPRLRDERAQRGARRQSMSATISLEHSETLRRGSLAVGMVPGSALRALVHGFAEVARDAERWPGLREATRRAVALVTLRK